MGQKCISTLVAAHKCIFYFIQDPRGFQFTEQRIPYVLYVVVDKHTSEWTQRVVGCAVLVFRIE